MEYRENGFGAVSVSEWLLTLIVATIPVIGFIAILLWAFGKGAATSKQNWAQAMLILYLIGAIFSIVFWGSLFAFASAAFLN
ncbi:MAG: hypothetical protein K9N06_03390 [Candidatus Cloacimonetes bacterium]|nr:hypothetical protein [Candidatus Cloacimonadota bacterium]